MGSLGGGPCAKLCAHLAQPRASSQPDEMPGTDDDDIFSENAPLRKGLRRGPPPSQPSDTAEGAKAETASAVDAGQQSGAGGGGGGRADGTATGLPPVPAVGGSAVRRRSGGGGGGGTQAGLPGLVVLQMRVHTGRGLRHAQQRV